MCVKVNKHLEALVLFGLLDDGVAGRPNRRVVILARIEVQSVEVACLGVEAVETARNTIRVQHHDHFEHEVLPKTSALVTSQTVFRNNWSKIYILKRIRILTRTAFLEIRSRRDFLVFHQGGPVTS